MTQAGDAAAGTMVVTGGGRGIGAATARLAAGRGYAVCVNYLRNREAAQAVVAAIHDAGGRAIAVAADVAREADVVRLFDVAHSELGAVTVLVNNAGILERQTRLDDMEAERFERDSLTIGLAREVADEGIRVNAVRPGVIYTEIHASGGEPGRVERVKAAVPMKRGGHPDEVARAILWLASAEASYSTGAFIDVSGGR